MSAAYVPFLRGILERRSGLDLGRGGMEATLANFVQGRLAKGRLSFERYLEQLDIAGSEELRVLVEAMTVVYTWFFRDPGQFLVIEELIQSFASDRTMSIWVAGCATGEEAYSVALVAAALGKRVQILGTDVNSAALDHARAGRYSAGSLNAIDAGMRERYIGSDAEDFVVPENVRETVRFELGNLVDAAPRAPTAGGWDLIICRNVLIYFTPEQARRTLELFANGLAPGRHLVLGASEAILERPTTLSVLGVAGRAVLQRPPSVPPRESLDLQFKTTATASSSRLPVSAPRLAIRPVVTTPAGYLTADKPSGVVRSHANTGGPMPPCTATALQQGRLALDAGDIATAKSLCTQAVNLDPTCAEAAMFAGIAHYLDGDFPEALRLLRGALCLDATLWAACFYQALCFENIGYADDAAHAYAQVVKIAEQHGHAVSRHSFLENWRSDLLAVAAKRARHVANGRDKSSQKIRIQAR